jgi:protein SCO1/2
MMNRRNFLTCNLADKSQPTASLGPEFYTNAVLRTHENKPVRFYQDLIKGKIVVINFMYAKCQGTCPLSTTNLVKVQKALQGRVGHDVFMYSITLKPEEDNPAVLKEYARMHGVKPGWLFLTGSEYDITILRFKLLRWDHAALDFDVNEHTGMVRIINDSLNRWTMCPTQATPHQIVEAISWVEPTKPLEVILRENREAQARFKRETQEANLAKAARHG